MYVFWYTIRFILRHIVAPSSEVHAHHVSMSASCCNDIVHIQIFTSRHRVGMQRMCDSGSLAFMFVLWIVQYMRWCWQLFVCMFAKRCRYCTADGCSCVVFYVTMRACNTFNRLVIAAILHESTMCSFRFMLCKQWSAHHFGHDGCLNCCHGARVWGQERWPFYDFGVSETNIV